MSSGSKETWTSLLEDMYKEKSQLIKNGCRTSEDISSDSVFREEFETLCRRNKERRLTWLSSKLLLSSYGHILELVDGVTEYVSNLQDLAPRVKLEGLVWWMSYAAIEVRKLVCNFHTIDRFTAWIPSWSQTGSPYHLAGQIEQQGTKV